MSRYSIFVSSSDAYADIWDVFFDMFSKFWPEFDGEIVLNTEEKNYRHPHLNINCTMVGKLGSFGAVFRAGLKKVETDNVLLIMIDYMFMRRVMHQKLNEYYNYFIEHNLDSFCLVHQNYPNVEACKQSEILMVRPPAPHVMFSYQIAFWKKNVLHEMALPHENPWMSEWYGSLRAEKMNIKLACLAKEVEWPIGYDLAGCLHQGKWLSTAVNFLKELNYPIDFNKRGFYNNEYNSANYSLKAKIMIWSTGLKGSYWDLLKRKKIH